MTACPYFPYIFCLALVCLSSYSLAYQHSILDSTTNNDDTKVDSNFEEQWLSNNKEDDYIDESRYNKASYKHEQDLLAKIYDPNRTYISMHDDRIYPLNFSYFTFAERGTCRIILISMRGDADLYISTRHKHVSYDNYEFSSCTCGIDEVLIDYTVKRPVYIGIYGYSRYQISQYRLLIELVDTNVPIDETVREQSTDYHSHRSTQNPPSSSMHKPPAAATNEDESDRNVLWNILLWILNILIEVLA